MPKITNKTIVKIMKFLKKSIIVFPFLLGIIFLSTNICAQWTCSGHPEIPAFDHYILELPQIEYYQGDYLVYELRIESDVEVYILDSDQLASFLLDTNQTPQISVRYIEYELVIPIEGELYISKDFYAFVFFNNNENEVEIEFLLSNRPIEQESIPSFNIIILGTVSIMIVTLILKIRIKNIKR